MTDQATGLGYLNLLESWACRLRSLRLRDQQRFQRVRIGIRTPFVVGLNIQQHRFPQPFLTVEVRLELYNGVTSFRQAEESVHQLHFVEGSLRGVPKRVSQSLNRTRKLSPSRGPLSDRRQRVVRGAERAFVQ